MSIGQIIMLFLCISFLVATAIQGKAIYTHFYKTNVNKKIFYLYLVCEIFIVVIVVFISIGVVNKHALDVIFSPKIPTGF